VCALTFITRAVNGPYRHSKICVRTRDERRAAFFAMHERHQSGPAQEQKQQEHSPYPPPE